MMPLMKATGRKIDTSVRVRGDDRGTHLVGAEDRGLVFVLVALFAVTEDVLQHHESRPSTTTTDQQQQPEQGDLVEREAGEVHDRERLPVAIPDAGGDDQGRAAALQEQEHHQRRQQRAEDQVLVERGDRLADADRVVGRNSAAPAPAAAAVAARFRPAALGRRPPPRLAPLA